MAKTRSSGVTYLDHNPAFTILFGTLGEFKAILSNSKSPFPYP